MLVSTSEESTLLSDNSNNSSPFRNISKKTVAWIIGLAIALVLAFVISISIGLTVGRNHIKNSDADQEKVSENPCTANEFPINYSPFEKTASTSQSGIAILIQNGTVWKATGEAPLYNYDVLLVNGKISEIGQNLRPNFNHTTFNVQGKWVTPGLVDTHSHLGVYSYPEDAWATQDGNELTGPTQPMLRAIDGLSPRDPAIRLIRSGGVTTSLILPGSGNVQGGQAAYVKLRGDTVQEMLIPNAPRALKMACGENPKRVYGSSGVQPDSRLGIGWLQRKQWYKAAKLKQQQEEWDCLNSESKTTTLRPEDLELEPLVSVLNGNARLMIHCYKIEDFEMMIRTSKEFGFTIATFQHALEAWKIPEVFLENNITIATFADNWGFKMEGYDSSVWAPKILADAGVPLALKSDHPVLFAKYLVYEAAKAHHYGLNDELALQSITIVPARGMGVDSHVGSLVVGKDADVVVWDRYPLQLGAKADKVIIEGNLIDNYNLPNVPKPNSQQASLQPIGTTTCSTSSNAFSVEGVTIYTMNDQNEVLINATILVSANGSITCMGTQCQVPAGTDRYVLEGGIVTPGLINVGASIGLVEVEAEANSNDGTSSVTNGAFVKAVDGISMNTYYGRHVKAAWKGGVMTSITSPLSTELISGVSVAFHTHGLTIDDALITSDASLDIYIGNMAKSQGPTGSVSGQFATLRQLFAQSNGTNDNIDKALKGNYPIVAHVDQVDQIAALLRLKQDYGFDLVILGGAEAYLLAPKLADMKVPVILVQSAPHTFETWHAVPNSASLLAAAGVNVGISILESPFPRNLRWEAGLASSYGLSWEDSLKAITKVPAAAFNLPSGVGQVVVGTKANFVAFSGDPLSLDSTIQLQALGGFVDCKPLQY